MIIKCKFKYEFFLKPRESHFRGAKEPQVVDPLLVAMSSIITSVPVIILRSLKSFIMKTLKKFVYPYSWTLLRTPRVTRTLRPI